MYHLAACAVMGLVAATAPLEGGRFRSCEREPWALRPGDCLASVSVACKDTLLGACSHTLLGAARANTDACTIGSRLCRAALVVYAIAFA
jgi:hypothetical protein